MSAARAEFEALLREALAPVEPPADLAQRLERTLASLTELAADELDAWELGAMRNPRNWVRPTAAAIVGSAAGTALVLVRVRQTHRRRRAVSRNPLDLARRTMGDAGREARRVLERLRR